MKKMGKNLFERKCISCHLPPGTKAFSLKYRPNYTSNGCPGNQERVIFPVFNHFSKRENKERKTEKQGRLEVLWEGRWEHILPPVWHLYSTFSLLCLPFYTFSLWEPETLKTQTLLVLDFPDLLFLQLSFFHHTQNVSSQNNPFSI